MVLGLSVYAKPAEPVVIHYAPDQQAFAFDSRGLQAVPSLAQTSATRLWATWYASNRATPNDTYVLLARSDDTGKSWTEPVAVIDEPGEIRAFDPCLWQDPLGRLWWFWSRSGSATDGVAGTWFVRCDQPNTVTPQWTEPRRIGNGVMDNKPTVMSTGEWVFPIALWARYGGTTEEHASNVYLTRDAGETFTRVGGARYPGRSFDEHSVLERRNGEWVLYTRLLAGGIGVSVSSNKGVSWSNQGTLPLPHPDARFFIRKLASGRWLLVHQKSNSQRLGLVAALSEDEGRTWKGEVTLDARNGVSYPDGVEGPDGVIRIIYDYGRSNERQILLTSVLESEILASVVKDRHAPVSFFVSGGNGILPPPAADKAPTHVVVPVAVVAKPSGPLQPNFSPNASYGPKTRRFQGIPSLEQSSPQRMWATWYSGGVTEGEENFVILAYSDDNGRNWAEPMAVLDQPGPVRAFDPCLWRDPLGRLWWFWAQATGPYDGVGGVWFIRCDKPNEDIPHWTEPKRIANGVMLNKPTVMSTGEWVFPIALWGRYGGQTEEHASNAYVTTDQGETFQRAGGAKYPNRSFDEHIIMEKRNGDWILFTRLLPGGIGISESSDKGHTWLNKGLLPVKHPDARFHIRRLASGNWLLIHQDSSTQRQGLTARFSTDEGKTWSKGLVLDTRINVSYPDCIQTADGKLKVIYDYNRYKEKEIYLVVFDEHDLQLADRGKKVTIIPELIDKATGAPIDPQKPTRAP